MINKLILLNLTHKKYSKLHMIIVLLIVILSFLSYKMKTYDISYFSGIITCEEEYCSILINSPFNKIDIFEQANTIEYLNKYYKIIDIFYDEPYLDSGIPYQDITIKTDLKTKSSIINFKVLYNKQRIIKKIIKMIEGD